MRRKVTKATLQQFMQELGAAAKSPGKVYLTGGATALLLGFREQTLDVDLKFDPEPAGVFEAIAVLKNTLDVNVELASPDDFIPVAEGWQSRSRLIATHGPVDFLHYDFYMQTLAKLERSHAQDIEDARRFLREGHVTAAGLRARLAEILPQSPRYPALDAGQFARRVETFLAHEEL
jgi:hypothetical protein